MFDFGPHSFYIIVSYIVTFFTITFLIVWIFALESKQVKLLEAFEAKGIKRRSAK